MSSPDRRQREEDAGCFGFLACFSAKKSSPAVEEPQPNQERDMVQVAMEANEQDLEE